MSDAPRSRMTGRHLAALIVAIVADLLQLPVTLALVGSVASVVGMGAALPAEGIDLAIDAAAALVTIWLLGFHWVLLPTAFLEAMPVIAAAPTWTGCVLFVIWRRRSQGADGDLTRT